MSYTKGDKEFLSGWHDGWHGAFTEIRQELLHLQYEKGVKIPIEVFKALNDLQEHNTRELE